MHKKVIGMIDSESSLGAMIKGYSSKEDITELVSSVWGIVADNSIQLFLDRVSSDANIADEPSRNIWKNHKKCGWALTRAEIPSEIR